MKPPFRFAGVLKVAARALAAPYEFGGTNPTNPAHPIATTSLQLFGTPTLFTALFVLSEATDVAPAQLAYYPEAFSSGSQRVLARLFPDAVLADGADAACFGLNGVSDGRNVVLPIEATALADRLAARGYEPVLIDISELRKAGGGPKCCTLEIRK